MANARVLLVGAGREATTSAAGAFVLDSVPGGSWTAEARAIGYSPTRSTVALLDGRPTSVALTFADRVNTLQQVVVVGQRSRTSELLDRIERIRRTGQGRVILADEIARRASFQISDVFRMVPGARVVPGEMGRQTVLVRGPSADNLCPANVFIDGMRMFDGATEMDWLVRPSEVMAVEVYTGTTVPPQYALGDRGRPCGAVVIWTKR